MAKLSFKRRRCAPWEEGTRHHASTFGLSALRFQVHGDEDEAEHGKLKIRSCASLPACLLIYSWLHICCANAFHRPPMLITDGPTYERTIIHADMID